MLNPLWQFSIDFYQRPGVEKGCLAWQEQFGADVNVLLFSLWCATTGSVLKEGDLRCLLADPALCRWQRDVVVPLRAVRRASQVGREHEGDQAHGADCEGLRDELYQMLLASELQAEEVEQQLLWHWARDNLRVENAGSPDQVVSVARQNLLSYGRVLSVAEPEGSLLRCFSDALRLGWGAHPG